MDNINYKALMERYNELNSFSVDKDETKDGLIKKLMDISFEKKQISNEANAIIREYIAKYEKDPSLLDEDALAALNEFLPQVMPSGGNEFFDPAIALRISKLLLEHYKAAQDLEMTVKFLRFCAVFDMMLKEHMDDYDGIPHTLEAEKYLSEFDKLSDAGKLNLLYCWLMCTYNRKDPAFGLDKYRDMRETFEAIRQKVGGDPQMVYLLVWFKEHSLEFALEAYETYVLNTYETEHTEADDDEHYECPVDIEKEAPLMEELKHELLDILASDNSKALIPNRVAARLTILRADYYLGNITAEEMLARLEEFSELPDDYDSDERTTAMFGANITYLEILCHSDRFERQYVLDKSMEIIRRVLKTVDDSTKEQSGQYLNAYIVSRYTLMLVRAASRFIEFDFFKNTTLNATICADKALYVHTMMVKEISLVLFDYILEHDPKYFDGVTRRGWEYWAEHKDSFRDLMENCALFHDIGKYFCLDVISNSSRSLTDDEFEIVKRHAANFSNVYTGRMSPELQCIRDCAHLHHLWYNNSGGYPRKKHTFNKPLVNILTVADCIDAATDNIGRPYGLGKTLEQLIAEFDEGRDTRYSGYVCELLHNDEIQKKISYIINDRRKEIYCDIYLGGEVK